MTNDKPPRKRGWKNPAAAANGKAGGRPQTTFTVETGEAFALHDGHGITPCRAEIHLGTLRLVREDGSVITLIRSE